jgi:hypothetical protein
LGVTRWGFPGDTLSDSMGRRRFAHARIGSDTTGLFLFGASAPGVA